MTTIYVATTGSDTTGNGTSGNPYATIPKASTVAVPGDVITVADGTYQGGFSISSARAGAAGNPIVCKSTNKWGAKIISGPTAAPANGYAFWDHNASYWTIQDFEIYGDATNTNGAWREGIYSFACTGITYQGLKVHDILRNATAWSTASGNGGGGLVHDADTDNTRTCTWDSNLVYNNGPDGNSSSTTGHGLYAAGRGTIKNNIVYNVSGTGITLWHGAQHVDIINNTVDNARGHGILIGSGDSGVGPGTGDNCNVQNNICRNCTTYGIVEGGQTGLNNTYVDNLLYANGSPISLQNGLTATGTITSDPLHVDRPNHDYHLQANSPAINAGAQTYAPSTDYDGNRRGVTLTPSGPVSSSADNQVIQNLDITATGASHGITVTHNNVTVKNCRIDRQGTTDDKHGVLFVSCTGGTVDNVRIIKSDKPATGQLQITGTGGVSGLMFNAVAGTVTVNRVNTSGMTRGLYIYGSTFTSFNATNLQLDDSRGTLGIPDAGCGIQLVNSSNITIDTFSVYNDVNVAWTGDNVNVSGCSNVLIKNGRIDGNNAPAGVGLQAENNTGSVTVQDVDCTNQCNGAAYSYSSNVTYTRIRAKNQYGPCGLSRGQPSSGAGTNYGRLSYIAPGYSSVSMTSCNYFGWLGTLAQNDGDVGNTMGWTSADFTPRSLVSLTTMPGDGGPDIGAFEFTSASSSLTKSFLASAALQKTLSKTASAGAAVQKSFTKTFTSNAAVSAALSKLASADAVLTVTTSTKSVAFSSDAAVSVSKSATASFDATLMTAVRTVSVPMDAALTLSFATTSSADAVITAPPVPSPGRTVYVLPS